MIRTQRGRGGQRIHRGGHQDSVTSREKTPDNKQPVKNNHGDNYNRGPSGSNNTGYRQQNYRGRQHQNNVTSGDRRQQVRNNQNYNYNSGATGNVGYGFRNDRPGERTGDGIQQDKNNHDNKGYGPQNKTYQHNYPFNFQRGANSGNDQARNGGAWKTAEGRRKYAANLGINGPERRTSHDLQVPRGDENRYNSLGSRMQYYEDNKLYNNLGNYTNNGRGREFRTPQELYPSALQLSGRGQRWIKNNTTSLKSGTEDRLGSGDNQRNIYSARDLLQEEYDIQAEEYAAKRRLRDIEIIQQKMIRLRFSSSFDSGHRLSEYTGDSGDKERVIQKLQEEYNHQSKQCAKEMNQVEERKKSLERARKIIGKHTPDRCDTPLGSEFTPNENTGAVPKKKRGENVSLEKKTKHKGNENKVASDSRSSRYSTNTSQTEQSGVLNKVVDILAMPSTSFSNVPASSGVLNEAVRVLTRPSSSSSNVSATTQRKWLFDTTKPVVSANGITTFIVKEVEVTDMTKFSPNSSDNKLREARRKMQEKLDKELALKKAEEDRKRAESSKQLPNTKNTVPLKSAVQKPKTKEEDRKKAESSKPLQNTKNTVALKSDLQKPKTKDIAVGIKKQKNVTEETADPSSATPSGLQMGFKEIGNVQIPELNVISKQSVAKNNAVLVLRAPKNESEAKKPADKTDTTLVKNRFNVQDPCVLRALETMDVNIQKPCTLNGLNIQEPCVLTALETMDVNIQKPCTLNGLNVQEPCVLTAMETMDVNIQKPCTLNGLNVQEPCVLTAMETMEVNIQKQCSLIATEQTKITTLYTNEDEVGTKKPIDSKNGSVMETSGVTNQKPYELTAVETIEVNLQQPHTLIATEVINLINQRLLTEDQKENENKPDACKETKVLSIQDQLRLRASKLNKEYEEQYEQLMLASKPDYEEQSMQASTSSKPDHAEQFEPYNGVGPTSSKPPQNVLNEVVTVPLIQNLNQINEYDRTGIVPQVIEYFMKGNRLFTTEGSDSCGRPVLKLRVN